MLSIFLYKPFFTFFLGLYKGYHIYSFIYYTYSYFSQYEGYSHVHPDRGGFHFHCISFFCVLHTELLHYYYNCNWIGNEVVMEVGRVPASTSTKAKGFEGGKGVGHGIPTNAYLTWPNHRHVYQVNFLAFGKLKITIQFLCPSQSLFVS